ncbi:hypothetical protein [Burkholderia pseudomallei]|uniref:hypothetical protein n=1 Tax=Burkholderia pseudomallei TaxID=28450 RepID=UPI000F14B3E0|nr:hypothetical protein [Burkholderia pseudomallei]VBT14647.1 Uncharacterised protein [Burkholderia pseudomallei]
MATNLAVQCAVYGALAKGSPNGTAAADVSVALQKALDKSPEGTVTINNTTMNGDPCPGYDKHFGAVVVRDGKPRYFACAEGQTINFEVGG